MINVQITDYTALIAFWLGFVRLSAIIFQLPIFDNTGIPNVVKVLSTLIITFAFFPQISPQIMTDINYVGVDSFWVLTVFNMIVGLLIGLIVKSIMQIFISAGAVISQQMGFVALQYFDPSAADRVGPYEKLIQWTVLIFILTSGALIPMFKGVFTSFSTIHLYDWGNFSQVTPFFVNFFKTAFGAALMLASPLIFTNVIVMITLGIIARTVPQMNVLLISFAINIGMGLLIFASISNEFFQVAYRIYVEKLGEWFQFVT